MRRRRNPKHVYGPNMAPMVDVVLVILVFFMATVALVGPEWFLAAALPERRDQPARADPFALPAPGVVVRVSAPEGEPLVDGLGARGTPLASFEALAREALAGVQAADLGVRLDGGPGASWQHVVAVQDVLTRLGVRRITLRVR